MRLRVLRPPTMILLSRLLSSAALAGLTLFSAAVSAQTAATPPKVLRYAFPIAESSFDPAQITDLFSRTVVSAMLDAPL